MNSEISYIFLTLHMVTWVLLILTYVELHSFKKEVRQIIDYETTLKKKRRELRNGD
jgi:cobalamin biosynthesis protein CobD/CbiB